MNDKSEQCVDRESMINYLVATSSNSNKYPFQIQFFEDDRRCNQHFIFKKSSFNDDLDSENIDIDIAIYDHGKLKEEYHRVDKTKISSFEKTDRNNKAISGITVEYKYHDHGKEHMLVLFIIREPIKYFFYHTYILVEEPHEHIHIKDEESKNTKIMTHNSRPGGGRN